MFRISSRTLGDEHVIKVEGCLAGPCVAELSACWRAAAGGTDPRRIHIDLTDTCHVDGAGRELISIMHQAGTRFIAKGCVMPELVREIAAAGAAERTRW